MSKSNPTAIESTAVDSDSDLSPVVEELVDVVKDQQETINQLEERVEQLEDDQADHQEQTARERAEDRKRLTDVEERVDDVEQTDNPHGSTAEDAPADVHERPQTPLEQTAQLPQEIIDQESANVRRAVFVAQDVTDYTQQVPAGRVIKSSELRKVLKAGTDSNGHSQTVDRVMAVLDDFGGDDVEIVDRRGERRVVFSEEISDRLAQLTTATQQDSHGVVTGGKV
jgi:TolA-binding protein